MNILYITHPLNGLLALALSIGLGIFLTRRFHIGWRLWWIGAATFVLSQIGHIPFNFLLTWLFKQGILPSPPENYALVFNAVVLGLSAGMWEEWTRYAVYRWWARDARSWSKGVLMGAGHGGIEAIFIGSLILFTFIQMVALRNIDLSTVVPAEQLELAQSQIALYWSSPWYDSLLGAVERAFTLPAQIALSIVVLQAFLRRHIRWVWAAVFWHAGFDALAVFAGKTWGVYTAEAIIGLNAVLCIAVIFLLRTPEPPDEPAPLPSPPPAEFDAIPAPPLTPEQLDNSRFSR